MLNACFTNQLNDNNNNIKYIVEATKSENVGTAVGAFYRTWGWLKFRQAQIQIISVIISVFITMDQFENLSPPGLTHSRG